MLLRRVIDHFRKQEWTAIAIDLAIVVVGVFMGIQVSNWNETRHDQNLAREYAARIYQDLAGDIDKYRRADEAANKRMAQIDLLSDVATNPTGNFDGQEFLIALEESSWSAYIKIEPSAYGELTTTGRTTLIEPVALRDKIAQYYESVSRLDRIALDQEPQRRFFIASSGLLNLRELEAIETAAWSQKRSLSDEFISRAHKVAEEMSAEKEVIRWLPRIFQHQVIVKNAVAAHRVRAEELMAEFERAYPQIQVTVQ